MTTSQASETSAWRWTAVRRAGIVSSVAAVLLEFAVGCPAPAPPPPDGAMTVGLELVASGFASPVDLASPDDESGRWFIVDQIGIVYVIDSDGRQMETPFLDVRDRMIPLNSAFEERGLLGMTFHPDFRENGRFYVFYSAPAEVEDARSEVAMRNRISEFRVHNEDANVADLVSERIILSIPKPQSNHNGGQIAFGPDGYLYLSTGDGGGANDTGTGHTPDTGNAQDTSTLLGKILRIDVDNGDPYAIPNDNPFINDADSMPEIWSLGLRNPWRFSFDRGYTNRLFVGDVGQNLFEEVNIVERGGNYGWNRREGSNCFNASDPTRPPASCASTSADGAPLIDPILAYPHVEADGRAQGTSVIGGFVYRGTVLSALAGRYIFADYVTGLGGSGRLFAAGESSEGRWSMEEMRIEGTADGRIGRFILAIGRDLDNELYLLTSATAGPTGSTGAVYKLISTMPE